jgi:hypothetical protein
MICKLKQGRLLGFDSHRAVVVNYATTSGYLNKTPTPRKWDIDHTIESTTEDQPNQKDLPELTQPNQIQPRFSLIMRGSMPLMIMRMTIMTVWHSAEVVYIPHESLSSLIALHTSLMCARTSLQGCSMVSPSLQFTCWGFIGGVSTEYHGPPLSLCGSQESALLYPLISSQAHPKRVHSVHTTNWYTKIRFNHILRQVIPI